MAYFNSAARLQEVFGKFFNELAGNAEIGPKLIAAKIIVKFNYQDPELSITIDCSTPDVKITFNDSATKAEVEMSMKADTAHKFWLGKVNLVAALTRGEIKAKGSIPKILKLLPVMKPAYVLYPQFLQVNNYSDLNNL